MMAHSYKWRKEVLLELVDDLDRRERSAGEANAQVARMTEEDHGRLERELFGGMTWEEAEAEAKAWVKANPDRCRPETEEELRARLATCSSQELLGYRKVIAKRICELVLMGGGNLTHQFLAQAIMKLRVIDETRN